MSVYDLVKKNRSFRRFYEDKAISRNDLKDMVEAARVCPSGRNSQSLKYILVHEPSKNSLVFPTLSWAGYLKDWGGPAPGERPSAYVLILNDTRISTNYYCDHGIASMAILLTAVEKGLGGCIIASVKRPQLQKALAIPDYLEILLVIALGVPKEKVVIDPLPPDGDTRYWRDAQEVHHVPKRGLEEIIVDL